ncbi:MAG TPA: MFS transporter [Planctomycetota bacterium]|nr:MFS transporter [Planctomycetota bacterium]
MRSVPAARVALASLAFLALGLPDGLLGVAWPAMRTHFGLPLDALGPLLVTFAGGYVAASSAGGRLLAVLGVGRLLALSCAATALSLVGYAGAGAFWMVVVLGLVAGAGAGGIDAGINIYAAAQHGPRMLNWLHACYGIGATGGPLILTAVLTTRGSWREGYVIVGAAQFGLASVFAATLWLWPPVNRAGGGRGGECAPLRATLGLPAARRGIALFFCYTGLELAVGTLLFTLLTEGRGRTMAAAGAAVASYWAALTGGRLIGAALASRTEPAVLVRVCLTTLTLGLGALLTNWSSTADLVGLVLAGFGAGPVFPTLVATTAARVGGPHAGNAIGLQVAAAVLGQATLPSLLAVLGRRAGLEALTLGLTTLGVLVVWLHCAAMATGRRNAAGPRPATGE